MQSISIPSAKCSTDRAGSEILLRYILTNLGEKMSDDEVDELLKAVDTSSGEINYMDLVRTILAN